MAVLDPEELFQQAEFLVKPRQPGPPRQVDVRRAMSAAYYGVFHFVVTAVADEFIGKTKQGDRRYALLYRSIAHGRIRKVCNAVGDPKSKLVAASRPSDRFGTTLRPFAATFKYLQERRHTADYDPSLLLRTSDAIEVIKNAREALVVHNEIEREERRAFLTLLAFGSRTRE